MNSQISPLEIPRLFLGLLHSLGPMYWVPIIAAIAYCFFYSFALRRSAIDDARNYAELKTAHWAHTIFWERLSRFDAATLVYLLCVPMGPVLFLLGVLNTLKH